MREGTAQEVYALLRADGLDAAFVGAPVTDLPASLAGLPLGEDDIVVACAPGHPLAAQATIALEQLAGERLVALPEGSTLRAATARVLADAGVALRVAFESDHLVPLRALVAHGLAVGLLPRTLVDAAGPPLVARPLAGPPPTVSFTLAWRAARRLPPVPAAFLALSREKLAGRG
jgi:DNA-binding transcriptional LysR family regulator